MKILPLLIAAIICVAVGLNGDWSHILSFVLGIVSTFFVFKWAQA